MGRADGAGATPGADGAPGAGGAGAAGLAALPLAEAARLARTREVKARELVEACLERIAADGAGAGAPGPGGGTLGAGAHGAWIELLADRALARADALDAGPVTGPLHGVPFAVKDIFEIEGLHVTCGSSREAGFARRPGRRTAPPVQALEEAGGILLGLLNMHEHAFGATTSNPHHGQARNPFDAGRVPGGSSGGSGIAPVLGHCFLALGTDTGGSVRLPASWCGAAGLKVTSGAVSGEGCYPLSWTLDSVGPLARSVADLAAAWPVLAATGTGRGARIARDPAAPTGIEGLRVGVVRGDLDDAGRIDPGVLAATRAAVAALESAGARVREVDLPGLPDALAAQLTITLAESATVHSGPERRPERALAGADVQRLLAMGDAVLAPDYLHALRFRRRFIAGVARVFDDVDVILSPTTPDLAEPVGAETVRWPDGSEESVLEACIRYLVRWNMAGAPALSLPCGLAPAPGATPGAGGLLPVGLQLAARPGGEKLLLAVGAEAEERFGWRWRP